MVEAVSLVFLTFSFILLIYFSYVCFDKYCVHHITKIVLVTGNFKESANCNITMKILPHLNFVLRLRTLIQ